MRGGDLIPTMLVPANAASDESGATKPADDWGLFVRERVMNEIPTGVYRHFKGGEYLVLGVAVHSETSEQLVVYWPQYGEARLTVRPLAMWGEHVERDGYSGPRFFKIPE